LWFFSCLLSRFSCSIFVADGRQKMEDRGLEPPAQPSEKRPNSPHGGAQSGALFTSAQPDHVIDQGLIAVIQSWPKLPEAIRAGILAMIRASG
jgi:hypothetical protein